MKQPTSNIEKPQEPTTRRRYSLVDWFQMSNVDVLNRFASLPKACKIGSGMEQCVYVPGTRKDKVLLVAHADTVFCREPEIGFYEGYYYSLTDGIGIGADDRAGCCMAWHLRRLGHSILIANGEESGCKGSRAIMKDEKWKKIINDEHSFLVEMDRMNDTDLAVYDIASKDFVKYIEANLPGYKETHGIHTDVCVLCESVCGFNISVGYYDQHGPNETLNEEEWEKTYLALRKFLSLPELKRFPLEKKVYDYSTPRYSGHSAGNSYNNFRGNDREHGLDTTSNIPVNHATGSSSANYVRIDDIVVCPSCEGVMDASEHRDNKDKCIFCQKEF